MSAMSLATKNTTLEQDFDRLRSRLCSEDFLLGKGLANELPFWVFPYDASKELEVRRRTAALVEESRKGALPCNIVEHDLWNTFLKIAEAEGILDKIPDLEKRRGSEALLKRLQKITTPEAFVRAMNTTPLEHGKDVLLITGVGKVYPIVRAHSILENAQPVFTDVPLVLMYPGRYDGQQLHLFDRIHDGNYYRAFNTL